MTKLQIHLPTGDPRPIDRFIVKYVKGVKTPKQARQWYYNQDFNTQDSIREGAAIEYLFKKARR